MYINLVKYVETYKKSLYILIYGLQRIVPIENFYSFAFSSLKRFTESVLNDSASFCAPRTSRARHNSDLFEFVRPYEQLGFC